MLFVCGNIQDPIFIHIQETYFHIQQIYVHIQGTFFMSKEFIMFNKQYVHEQGIYLHIQQTYIDLFKELFYSSVFLLICNAIFLLEHKKFKNFEILVSVNYWAADKEEHMHMNMQTKQNGWLDLEGSRGYYWLYMPLFVVVVIL